MSNTTMTLGKLLESKAFVKGAVTFDNPSKLLEKSLNIMSKVSDEFEVKVSNKVVNAEADKTLNEAYSRVLLQPIIPTELEGMVPTIGLLYALDTQRPIIKTYTGTKVTACNNLCVFNADDIFSGDLSDMSKVNKFLTNYVEQIEETLQRYIELKNSLEDKEYKGKDVDEAFGGLLRHSIANTALGTTSIVQAAKEVNNSSSVYYVDREKGTTAWNLYNSVTEFLKKSDIKDQATKTLILSNYFLN